WVWSRPRGSAASLNDGEAATIQRWNGQLRDFALQYQVFPEAFRDRVGTPYPASRASNPTLTCTALLSMNVRCWSRTRRSAAYLRRAGSTSPLPCKDIAPWAPPF